MDEKRNELQQGNVTTGTSKKWVWPLAGCGCGILAFVICVLLIAIIGAIGGDGEYTVADFRNDTEQKINRELCKKNNPINQLVEAAHLTVTVTEAYVSDVRASTKDGSNLAGRNGSNIKNAKIYITTRWDGNIHKNGKTVVELSYERVRDEWKVMDAKIVETDALVTTTDPDFWYKVGVGIAILLL